MLVRSPGWNIEIVEANLGVEAIQQDAGDPDFVRKLNELGPVKVDHRMSSGAGQIVRVPLLFPSILFNMSIALL